MFELKQFLLNIINNLFNLKLKFNINIFIYEKNFFNR
jgi:hypothetical protein